MMSQIEGLLLIPHELLHLTGYRLVGKRCRYQWGDHYVTPVGSMAKWQRLVGLLFPFIVCLVGGFILLAQSGAMFFHYPTLSEWSILLAALASAMLVYAGTSLGDLRQAYLLIFSQPQEKTPFDSLFWPVMVEHRRGVRWSATILLLVCLVLLYISLA